MNSLYIKYVKMTLMMSQEANCEISQDVLCLAYCTWIREGYLAVLIFSSGRYRKAPFYSNSLFCHMLKQHIEQEKM